MGQEAITSDYKLTAEWFTEQLDLIWQPFLLGCFVSGVISAIIAYTMIRLLWRLHLVRHIKARRARLKQQKKA